MENPLRTAAATPCRSDFEAFMNAVRRRDTDAIRRLVEQYDELAIRTIRAHLHRALRTRLDSQDLRQDFWVSVFRRIDRIPYIARSVAFRAYMKKIAHRQVTKQVKRHITSTCRSVTREVKSVDMAQRVHSRGETADTSPGLSGQLATTVVPKLTSRQVAILNLRLADHSNRSIARQLRINERTVRRDLRQIARVIGDNLSD